MWQKKKVSCKQKKPVDSDSWGPIKQPYVSGFSRSIRRGEFFTSKVWDSCYFCLIFSFVMISMKIFETYRIDWYNCEELLEFFFRIFRSYLSPGTRFLAGKTWFLHFWSYVLGHGIKILITPLMGTSEKSTLNFFQNFSWIPFSRNDFLSSKNATVARENVTRNAISGLLMHGLRYVLTRLISPSEKNASNFFQHFSSISFSRNNS